MTTEDAAKRAYGLLWRDATPSLLASKARRELFDAMTHEQRREGIAWALNMLGPMSDNEMIAADIRVGVFPNKSTERA